MDTPVGWRCSQLCADRIRRRISSRSPLHIVTTCTRHTESNRHVLIKCHMPIGFYSDARSLWRPKPHHFIGLSFVEVKSVYQCMCVCCSAFRCWCVFDRKNAQIQSSSDWKETSRVTRWSFSALLWPDMQLSSFSSYQVGHSATYIILGSFKIYLVFLRSWKRKKREATTTEKKLMTLPVNGASTANSR